MDIDVVFVVPVVPVGKQRPRVVRKRGGGTMTFTPTKTMRFEGWVALIAQQTLPRGLKIDEPVRIDIAAVGERPQRLEKEKAGPGLNWRGATPDADNVRKAVLDGLKHVLANDSRVVAGETLSLYAELGGKPRVVVRIRTGAGVMDAGDRVRELGIASDLDGRRRLREGSGT